MSETIKDIISYKMKLWKLLLWFALIIIINAIFNSPKYFLMGFTMIFIIVLIYFIDRRLNITFNEKDRLSIVKNIYFWISITILIVYIVSSIYRTSLPEASVFLLEYSYWLWLLFFMFYLLIMIPFMILSIIFYFINRRQYGEKNSNG